MMGRDGLEVSDSNSGFLETQSPAMYSGYLTDLETMAIESAPEWFATSDSVSATGDIFEFLGRESNILNVGGVKFDVSPIEDFVRSLPGVRDALSFAAESNEAKEVHVMAIVLDSNETLEKVQSNLNERYPGFAPRIFWRTESIERVGLDKAARWRTRQSFEKAYRKS